ncbi:MAG: sulfatase-like hydrolase/transferase [Anaerolineae bacterium]|nr:sulfatase-like hydrolase/transferase [Anaerolineae bacterium]
MTEQPNILVILTDDHGQWASGCYGNKEIHTPAMDYLAQAGVRMANAFTPTPVCSPARASFFTGLYASQHGIHDWLYYFRNRPETDRGLNDRQWLEDPTLAQVLSQNGYQCALSGKWHCGQDDEPQPGFDYWYSLRSNYPPQGGEYSDHGTFRSYEGYHTDFITDNAVSFLRQRDQDRPFFLFVGYIGTHSPWAGHPERLVEQYRECSFEDIPADTVYPFGRLAGESTLRTRYNAREALAQYYASVTHIDEGIGRLLDELEAQGVDQNTLVVYTADHGLNCGQHGVWGKGNGTRPLNMLDESIRIPMIFHHPNQLFAGQVRAEFVDHCDLFETLLDYARASFDRERLYPGRSFKSILEKGQTPTEWKDAQFGEYGDVRMIRTRRYKLITRNNRGANQLFDLERDPRETTDVYHDPAYREIVAQLITQLDQFFTTYQDSEKNGLRVQELPQHNFNEAWRDEPV